MGLPHANVRAECCRSTTRHLRASDRRVREHAFDVPEFSFNVTTYDPAKPWIVLSREHRVVELAEGVDFSAWARREYPGERTVELDPKVQQPWPAA